MMHEYLIIRLYWMHLVKQATSRNFHLKRLALYHLVDIPSLDLCISSKYFLLQWLESYTHIQYDELSLKAHPLVDVPVLRGMESAEYAHTCMIRGDMAMNIHRMSHPFLKCPIFSIYLFSRVYEEL